MHEYICCDRNEQTFKCLGGQAHNAPTLHMALQGNLLGGRKVSGGENVSY